MSRPLGKPQKIGTNAGVSEQANDGVMAAGLCVPGAGLPSQFVNYKDGDHAQRLRDVDTIEIRNWHALINSLFAGPTPSGTPTFVKGIGAKLWHEERPLLFAASSTELMISYDGGRTWAVDFTAGGPIDSYAQAPNVNAIAYVNGGVGTVARNSLGSAWAGQTLTSCTATKAIRWDPYANEFVVIGTHSGSFGIWKAPVVSGALTFTAFDTGSTAVSRGHFAASPTNKLAASDTTLHIWTASGGFTPTSTLGPQGGGVDIEELLWIPGPDVFMLIAHAGGAAEVWVSPDGVSWTARTSLLPVATTFNGYIGQSAAVRGSIFAMCGTQAGRYGILWTGDAGLSWNWEPDPTVLGGGTPTTGVAMLGIGDRQWLAASYDGTGNFDLAFGMRMGE